MSLRVCAFCRPSVDTVSVDVDRVREKLPGVPGTAVVLHTQQERLFPSLPSLPQCYRSKIRYLGSMFKFISSSSIIDTESSSSAVSSLGAVCAVSPRKCHLPGRQSQSQLDCCFLLSLFFFGSFVALKRKGFIGLRRCLYWLVGLFGCNTAAFCLRPLLMTRTSHKGLHQANTYSVSPVSSSAVQCLFFARPTSVATLGTIEPRFAE